MMHLMKLATQVKKYCFSSLKTKLVASSLALSLVPIAVLLISLAGFELLSGVRGFVGGEGLWSKSQKDANYYLWKYIYTKNEDYYKIHKHHLKVPKLNKLGRLEMLKPDDEFDYDKSSKMLIEAGNHPDDIAIMTFIFRELDWVPRVQNIIDIWERGDKKLEEQESLSIAIHQQIKSSTNISIKEIKGEIRRLEVVNDQLTKLENEFSHSLGETSRWLKKVLMYVLVSSSLLFLGTAIYFSNSIGNSILKRVRDLGKYAERVGEGDYQARIEKVGSDEISDLTESFVDVSKKREFVESKLFEQTKELSLKNSQLEQFISFTAHDISEPLRIISFNIEMLLDDEKRHLSVDAVKSLTFLSKVAQDATKIVEHLIYFTRISSEVSKEVTTLSNIISQSKSHLIELLNNSKAKIELTGDTTLNVNTGFMTKLFECLFENSIIFCDKEVPHISIELDKSNRNSELIIYYKDNSNSNLHKNMNDLRGQIGIKNSVSGASLNLAIAQKIIETHGGNIKPLDKDTFDVKYEVTLET